MTDSTQYSKDHPNTAKIDHSHNPSVMADLKHTSLQTKHMADTKHKLNRLSPEALTGYLRRYTHNALNQLPSSANTDSAIKTLSSDQFWTDIENQIKDGFTTVTYPNIEVSSQSPSELEISNIVTHSPLVVIRWSTTTGWPILFASENIFSLTGYSSAELCRGDISYSTLIHPEDLPHVITIDKSYSEENIRDGSMEYRLIHRNGSIVHIIEYSSDITDDLGNVIYTSGILHNVTEMKNAQEQADLLTFYDPLTGLENRDLLKKRLDHTLKMIVRNKTGAALLFLDVDRFKIINDSLGHHLGDTLLKIVADRLRKCLREEDTIARLGGDEFAIILPSVEAISGADIVAQNILNALNTPINLETQEIIITASIGIAMAPSDATDTPTLLKNAELAMYQAKAQGRNTYRFYINEMNAAAEERLFIQNGLRHAIKYNEFVLFFQPQVSLNSNRMHSMEALVRWKHPERGMIPPKDFIGIAEESGLIIDIGNWVLEESCKKAQKLIETDKIATKVCVNLSPAQFYNKDLVRDVKSILSETMLDPSLLELEITESMLFNNVEETIATLNHLKNIGISLSIDDFGTGYSSLSYLKRLPIDIVKVDQSFIRDIPNDLNDMEITSAVISMAHNLQLKVVAEGVETEDQRDFLAIAKCDYAQGYFFSKPVPSDVVASIINAHNAQQH